MKRKLDNTINAGSMADIAFLLLLFFLVATTIQSESGIYVRLPPYSNQPPVPLAENKVITVKVNAENRFLIEGEEVEGDDMSEMLMDMIVSKIEANIQPILSIQVDRMTSYESYILGYNEIKKSYRVLRESKSMQLYNRGYQALNMDESKRIDNLVPMIISEAEPYRS